MPVLPEAAKVELIEVAVACTIAASIAVLLGDALNWAIVKPEDWQTLSALIITFVGANDGSNDGVSEGNLEGENVGIDEGTKEGLLVGSRLGILVGM